MAGATSTPRKAARAKPARAARRPKAPRPEMRELGRAFRGVFRTLNRMRGRDTHLCGGELSHAQFELLIELFERGELPAGELAAAAGLTPATVTQMLDQLAAAGHVERARSETDRRVVVSRLTPGGALKVQARREEWQLRWEQALSGIDDEELQTAVRVLGRLGAMFEEASMGEPGAEGQNPSQKAS